MLDGHQPGLVIAQRPVLDQLIKLSRTRRRTNAHHQDKQPRPSHDHEFGTAGRRRFDLRSARSVVPWGGSARLVLAVLVSWPGFDYRRWATTRSVRSVNGARHTGQDQGNRPGCSRVLPGGPNATVEASGRPEDRRRGRGHENSRLSWCPSLMWTGQRTSTRAGMAALCRLRHRPGLPGDTDDPARLGLRDHFRHRDHLGRAPVRRLASPPACRAARRLR